MIWAEGQGKWRSFFRRASRTRPNIFIYIADDQHKDSVGCYGANPSYSIATPLIAYWPSVIMDRGAITHQTGHVMDIMATCLDLAGAKYPKTYNEHDITPLEGKSLLPIFQGNTRESHEFICWEHEGNRAIRQGRWKLVSYYNESHQFKVGKGERTGKWELYDLEADRTEMHNLAGKHPEKAAELQNLFEKWSKKVGVVPWETLEAINTRLQKKEQVF